MARRQSTVGDPINFRAMMYAPLNEAGVVVLFGMVAQDFGMRIEETQQGFPDCYVRRFNGSSWDGLAVEFEFHSRTFLDHKHDPDQCDLIVCWKHNWADCPLPVIELSKEIRRLPNGAVARLLETDK